MYLAVKLPEISASIGASSFSDLCDPCMDVAREKWATLCKQGEAQAKRLRSGEFAKVMIYK